VRVVAIVLAAGEGRRIGGPKALLRLGEETFLERGLQLFSRPDVARVIGVVGAEADRVVEGTRPPGGTRLVVNDRWGEGMLTSVWAGLDAARDDGADAVLLHPVDHPVVAPETIGQVVAALREGAFVAVPSWEGRRGHPGGFGPEACRALRAAPLERGAREVLAANAERVVHVPGDPGCRRGVNTLEDYQLVLRWSVAPPPTSAQGDP